MPANDDDKLPRIGLVDTLAAIIPDHRDPTQIIYTMSDILRARILAIACGYPDTDDLGDPRKDPRSEPRTQCSG